MLSAVPQRGKEGPFRLPIDRAFTVKGVGTVVTGTVYEGSVHEGDVLELLPGGKQVKVRQLQVHKDRVDFAFAGQRTAVNLSGVDVEEVQRGDVLTTPDYFHPTDRVDISLSVLPDLSFMVKQRSPVCLHLGTSEMMGKIVLFDRNELGPGDDAVAQLVLEETIVVKKGDRFILRRPTPADTIGGGGDHRSVCGKASFRKGNRRAFAETKKRFYGANDVGLFGSRRGSNHPRSVPTFRAFTGSNQRTNGKSSVRYRSAFSKAHMAAR